MGIASDLILIVLAAFLGGLIAHAFRQPVLIGFILAGIVVGPYTSGPTVEHVHHIETLAEVGVALLLFAIGLEFSLSELRRLAKVSFLAAPLQMILCLAACYLVAVYYGVSRSDALWIGGAVALSSTMVVIKTLAARDALDSPSGRAMLAVLIAQDIAVVPLIIILPQLSGPTLNVVPLLWALGKSVLFLGAMYVAGTQVFPRLFGWIGKLGSTELFFVATLSVALGAGYLSHHLGLSFALGAFVAGMMLSETDFNHQALSDVSGLRDLFGLIFFVSVGMLFDPQYFVDHLGAVLFGTLVIVTVKGLLVAIPLRISGFDIATALGAGLGLAQVGEFAFVVSTTGVKAGQLSQDSFSFMLSVTVVSMVITPALLWLGDRCVGVLSTAPQRIEEAPALEVPPGHVLIVGGGVVGVFIAQVLESMGKPYLLVELNYKNVSQLRAKGLNVMFGDGSHRAVLGAAGVTRASLVVLVTTRDSALAGMATMIKQIAPQVPIVARVEEIESAGGLPDGLLHEVVHPQMEVALEMVRQSLVAVRVDEQEISSTLEALRVGGYHIDGSPTREKVISARQAST